MTAARLAPAACAAETLRHALLDRWQRDFPLVTEPYAQIAAVLGSDAASVLQGFAGLRRDGAISRIGAVWGAGAGGAAMLCAFALPPGQLAAAAAIVSAEPGVNHNYEREHDWNLWFVATATDRAALGACVDRLEARLGRRALRLPMRRAYRIDLGFGLDAPPVARDDVALDAPGEAVAERDRPLAALLEEGLPLVERPYDAWADALQTSRTQLLATLARWQRAGTVRRYGVIVRHHELGIVHNAMCVFALPDDAVDAAGAALAACAGVTLCYRREPAPGWPYQLYCMVHGRDRAGVLALLAAATARAGLRHCDQAVLFSRRRFKQQGARYFRSAVPAGAGVPA